LFAFVVLGLDSSVPSQEIGWKERFRVHFVSRGSWNLNAISHSYFVPLKQNWLI